MKNYMLFFGVFVALFSCTKQQTSLADAPEVTLKTTAVEPLDILAGSNKFDSVYYQDSSYYVRHETSGDYVVTVSSDSDELVILDVLHNSETATVEFNKTDSTITFTDMNLIKSSFMSISNIGDSVDNYLIAGVVGLVRLKDPYGQLGMGLGYNDSKKSFWYCFTLGRNDGGCGLNQARMEAAVFCGDFDFTLGQGSTSCLWNNHGCITTRSVTCN